MPAKPPIEVVIPKERAVFRLDARGRWCNMHGVFRNRRISDYFHAAIRCDENGYFVCQQRGEIIEKVYFPYEDTAIFAVDVETHHPTRLRLNTGREVLLTPEKLFIDGDSMYTIQDDERIKFSERAMLKLAETMEFSEEGYFIIDQGRRHRIREITAKDIDSHQTEKERPMFKVSVMYPNQDGVRFDFDYYRTKHMDLVIRLLKPFGLMRTEVLKGISGGAGQSAPYCCIGNLYFETADGYEKGVAASAGALRSDMPNFTNATPVRQISEVLASG